MAKGVMEQVAEEVGKAPAAPKSRAASKATRKASQDTTWYYCTEESHPGSPNFQTAPLHEARLFEAPASDGCPECPACGKQVNAVEADGPTPPESIVSLARRLGQPGVE